MSLMQFIAVSLEQFFVHFPLVLGGYLSLSLLKAADLSIETAFVFGAMCAARTAQVTHMLPAGIYSIATLLSAILGGALVGLFSSTLTRKCALPHLLSSIITFGIFHGVIQIIAQTYVSLSNYPNYLTTFAWIPRHPEFIFLGIIAVLIFIFGYFFCTTQLGYSIAIFGQNPRFFSHYNISASYIFMSGIIIANACAGLSGYLFAQTNGFAEINMGIGKALFCIACIVLGKQLIGNKEISIFIPLLGGLTYFGLQQSLLKIGFDSKYFTMIQSCVLLIILILMVKRSKNTKELNYAGI